MTAVHRGVPDRVPIDLHGESWVLDRLRDELGTPTHRELLEHLHCDVVDLRYLVDPTYRGPVPFSRDLPGGVRESFWGWRVKRVMGASGPAETYVDFPLAGATTIEELERHPWPTPDWFDFSDFKERLEPWRDFAVMATNVSVFQHPSFVRGFDELLMDMALAPEMAEFVFDRFTDFYLGYFDRMLSAADGRIDILRQGDDLGTQTGPLISPEMFRTYLKPRIAQFVDLAHSHGVAFMYHSCGAIRPFVEDLIEVGIDILDPLQAAAAGMEAQALKDAYGDRVCLHGAIDTQYLLPQGTPSEVAAEVGRLIEILGAGGGYVLAPCHVLQADVPTANVLAMRDATLAYRYQDGVPVARSSVAD